MQVDAAAHPCDSSAQKVEAGESEGRTATWWGLVCLLRAVVPKDTQRVLIQREGSIRPPT